MKYLLPREYLALAERALRDYPERNRESKLVAKAVRAMCHSPVHGTGPVSIPASEPERVTEALERNKDYQRLSKFCSAVEGAVAQLSKEERAIVRSAFWEHATNQEIADGLHMDERTMRRHKNRILRKTAKAFICNDIWEVVNVKLSLPGQG